MHGGLLKPSVHLFSIPGSQKYSSEYYYFSPNNYKICIVGILFCCA